MHAIFPGRIALGDDEPLDVDLAIEGSELRLVTPVADIGSWPLAACRLDPIDSGMFRLTVDDESVDFAPAEPEALLSFLDRLAPGGEDARLPETPGSLATAPVDAPWTAEPWTAGASPRDADPEDDVVDAGDAGEVLDVEGSDEQPPTTVADSIVADSTVAAPIVTDSTVADSIVADSIVRESRPLGRSRLIGGVAVGAVLVALLAVSVLGGGAEGSAADANRDVSTVESTPEPGPTIGEPARQPVSTGSPASPPTSAETVFELPAAGFVDVWNGFAAPIAPALAVGVIPGPGVVDLPLSSGVSFSGVVGSDATVDSFGVVVQAPDGVPQLGLQALGVVVAVAEPELSGPDRARVLASLGFDVASPVSDGLDGSIIRSGVSYRLTAVAGRIELSVTPGEG